jgi:peptide deformylase
MELVKYNDLILKSPGSNFNFNEPPFNQYEFAQDLVKFMYDKNAICITAPQVGIPYRIFAMRAHPQNFVCINPKIVQPSKEIVLLEETSLTYPGIYVKIKRPQHCRVRFAMPNGDVRTETFTGVTARTFQHCMDYLDGIAFYSKANPYHRTKAFKKWRPD